jgi:predicted metal-dependent HD superfamily phosphohydrolase
VSELADDLRRQWATLVAAAAGAGAPGGSASDLGDRLLAAYAEDHRHYHDQRHLAEVLTAIDRLAGAAGSPAADLTTVRLAAWFHDALYDPAAAGPANEEASARLAEQLLPGLGIDPDRVHLVATLVRATAAHDGPLNGLPDAATEAASAVLDDADLAILASPPQRYAEYTAGVRAEYAHVPEPAFRAGRRQILQGFLERPRIYRTPAAYDAWEATARAQVAAEVRALS